MRLSHLLPTNVLTNILGHPDASDPSVTGLSADSRSVQAGHIFVAVPGTHIDGRQYAAAAVRSGAIAIVGEGGRPDDLAETIPYIQVRDAHQALALMAARFYPEQPATLIAITGTSGKSSVADFTRQIFTTLGHAAASVGTVGVVSPAGERPGALTTPDPVQLHQTLQMLAQEGVTHLALEASSHGLDQRRLDGVKISAAAFLNLGRDHLDYHPSLDAYFTAKMRLFDIMLPGFPAVINIDDPRGSDAVAHARARGLHVITVGRQGETLHLIRARREGAGQRLLIGGFGTHHQDVTLPLIGDFQAQNALAAAGLAIATGADRDAALSALSSLTGVKGRLERVGEINGAIALVDYAHKPEALAAVLDTLRPYTSGRLICVFGCGGDRDAGKRPLMGRIAARKADIVIITDDNPRSEDPAAIRAAIRAGITGEADHVRTIGSRAEAIETAVKELQPGDVLVVAGKGHETGQIVGDKTLPFSDHDVLRDAMKNG